jgi:hypothetical protein
LFLLRKQILGKKLFAIILWQHFQSCVLIMHATTSSGSCIYFCQRRMVIKARGIAVRSRNTHLVLVHEYN